MIIMVLLMRLIYEIISVSNISDYFNAKGDGNKYTFDYDIHYQFPIYVSEILFNMFVQY
jgi:hypothetical protein